MLHRLFLLFLLISIPARGQAAGEATGRPGALLDSPLWHVDTFEAVTGTYSAWCGSFEVISCAPSDQDGGYGASYDEVLEWRGTVTNPALPCTVSVAAVINIDTMWGYDFFFISCQTSMADRINLLFQDGLFADLPVSGEFVYEPGDYVGANGDEVVVQFRVTSDGGWDGADCLWPNDGAVQLDDVAITLSNGAGYSHDFEDSTLGDLMVPTPASNVPALANFTATAHPNPFNPVTTITYTIGQAEHLTVKVFDLKGRLVRTLHDGPVAASGAVTWDGTGRSGGVVPSGIYFYEARLGAEVLAGKLALVK